MTQLSTTNNSDAEVMMLIHIVTFLSNGFKMETSGGDKWKSEKHISIWHLQKIH
jgi:hypothetical protein